jgi:predicted metallopeptidase
MVWGVRKKRRGKSVRMKYESAPDLQTRMLEIIEILKMEHIKLECVKCIRSFGSSTRNTIARCHALGKVMQLGMGTDAFYTIEFLEAFDKMSKEDQDKTIIHELMHIPKAFGGGFRHHDFVCDENVELMHEQFESLKRENERKGEDSGYLFWKKTD